MRMRRKRHRESRLENCVRVMVNDIYDYKTDLKKIFSNVNPLHIEIGCGKGGFISEMAQLNPEINYLAFEKNPDVLVLAAEKAVEKNLKNVKFVLGDVGTLVDVDEQESAERLYINFCDPWPKRGHRKRRLTHSKYLQIYQRVMNKNAEIHFKTDNPLLFEFSLNSFSDYGMKLKNITLDLHNSGFEGNVMTEYEKLFSEKGQPIYRCEATFCQQ